MRQKGDKPKAYPVWQDAKKDKRTVSRKAAILAVAGSVLFAVILAVVLGLALGEKAKKLDPPDSPETVQTEKETSPYIGPVRMIGAVAYDKDLNPADATALSVEIFDGQGNPNYAFETDTALGLGTNGDISFADAMRSWTERDVYVSVLFRSTAFGLSGAVAQRARAEYEKALLFEIARYGPDEIILLGLPVDADSLEATSEYLSSVSQMNPGVCVGLGLPCDGVRSAEDMDWPNVPVSFVAVDFSAFAGEKAEEGGDTFENCFADCFPYIIWNNSRILLDRTMTDEWDFLDTLEFANRQRTAETIEGGD
ncbi:MAG: hypothetical protein IJU20_05390 [Clostridia bacterium]|nr:hypothetical protein [Clostridia bacterium]